MIRGRAALTLAVVVLVAACSAPPPSLTPPPPPTSVPTAAASPTSSTPATASPSPVAVATPSPSPTPVPTDCPLRPETGRLPSDRMTDVRITSADGADIVTFVFGDPSSAAPPQGVSEGSLDVAEPPFVGGASGLPLEVDGARVLEIRFSAMTLGDDDESPTYEGENAFRPDLPAVRSVVLREAFEGILSWYIGYDGPGCVTLSSSGGTVSIVVAHSAG